MPGSADRGGEGRRQVSGGLRFHLPGCMQVSEVGRARTCKRLRSPGISSEESIPPAFGPVRQICLLYRPAVLGSIPVLLKRFTNTISASQVNVPSFKSINNALYIFLLVTVSRYTTRNVFQTCNFSALFIIVTPWNPCTFSVGMSPDSSAVVSGYTS